MSETLYVDSSAALKLYFPEDGATEAIAAMDGRELVASRLTQVEVGRALRKTSDRPTNADDAVDAWQEDWESYAVIELTERIAAHAVSLATHHGLRTLDAIHLASALRLSVPLRFATWDRRLWDGARAVGLRTVPAQRP